VRERKSEREKEEKKETYRVPRRVDGTGNLDVSFCIRVHLRISVYSRSVHAICV